MTKTTETLLDTIEAAHDWEQGQVYAGGGTRYSSTDKCRTCGLVRRWFDDSQNGVSDRYSFSDFHGEAPLTLRDAASLSPCIDEATV